MRECKNHPGRRARGRGLCESCYGRWLRCNNPEWYKRELEKHKVWVKENRNKVREGIHSYYVRNRDHLLSKEKNKWKHAHPEKKFEKHLKQKYGIALSQYYEILSLQDGCCAICREITTGRLLVDHDHITGEIRGLLCNRCNSLLGFIESMDRVMVENALRYVEGQSPVRIEPMEKRKRIPYPITSGRGSIEIPELQSLGNESLCQV